MAVTKNKLIPQQTFSNSTCQCISSNDQITCHLASSALQTSRINCDGVFNATYLADANCNRTQFVRSVSTPSSSNEPMMYSFSSNESSIIPNDNCVKLRSKSIGGFATSLMNSRYQDSEYRNNNYNRSHHNPPSALGTLEEGRVPVNGEPTLNMTSNLRFSVAKPPMSQSSSQESSRKNSFSLNSNVVSIIKMRDFMYTYEPWRDDSLSLSSSFSSMSSLPSLPSPTHSPPSSRPQSLPKCADISSSDTLSASLPEPPFMTAYCRNSCGTRKRVKDAEGFIRRAACICLNETETQVRIPPY